MDTLEETPVVEEQMEDLTAFNEQQNAEYRQRQRDELKTVAGQKKFLGAQIGKFTNKLLKDERYAIPFVVCLVYIFATGIWFVFANLISYITVFIVLVCISLVNRKKIKTYALIVKNYISHLLFRVKSVFIKRK